MKFGTVLQVGNGNPGDSIASYSARALFRLAQPETFVDTWPLFEDAPFDYGFFRFVDYDYALLLCTPWVWDQAQNSLKYKVLADFLAKTNAIKSIGLGLGAAFLLHHDNPSEAYTGQFTAEGARPFFSKVSPVVCRDRVAYTIFSNMLGEDRVHLMPCPSFYSAQLFGITPRPDPGKDKLLVFADITPETHHAIRQEDLEAAMAHQDMLVAQGVDTLVMTDIDGRKFRERYGPHPTYNLRGPRNIIELIARFRSLVSPRVHACMPALSLGLDVEIIPLDSRALTAIHVGARPVAVELQAMEKHAAPLPRTSLQGYVDFLRRVTA